MKDFIINLLSIYASVGSIITSFIILKYRLSFKVSLFIYLFNIVYILIFGKVYVVPGGAGSILLVAIGLTITIISMIITYAIIYNKKKRKV